MSVSPIIVSAVSTRVLSVRASLPTASDVCTSVSTSVSTSICCCIDVSIGSTTVSLTVSFIADVVTATDISVVRRESIISVEIGAIISGGLEV